MIYSQQRFKVDENIYISLCMFSNTNTVTKNVNIIGCKIWLNIQTYDTFSIESSAEKLHQEIIQSFSGDRDTVSKHCLLCTRFSTISPSNELISNSSDTLLWLSDRSDSKINSSGTKMKKNTTQNMNKYLQIKTLWCGAAIFLW